MSSKGTGTRTGTEEKSSYTPLITLCNTILSKIRAEPLKENLDLALQGEDAQPLQFMRHDTMYLWRDWHGGDSKPVYAPIKPDIILVHSASKSVCEYIQDQRQVKSTEFDPSEIPASKHPDGTPTRRIKLQNVLCCGEIKWDRAPGRNPKGVLTPLHAASKAEATLLSSDQPQPASSEHTTIHHSQLARYAAEMLSRGPYATHTLGIALNCELCLL